jgi:hypothetical protein
MAYVQCFTKIPQQPSKTSGFYAIAKAKAYGQPRYECVSLDQIIRPCPLAPIIRGAATPEIEGHASLDHYDEFYINKYRNPHDYAWVHTSG